MAMSTKLSVAVHILSLLEIEASSTPTSTDISKSVNTNPVVIRRIMSQLKQAGLLESQPGKKVNRLAKDASDISLYDIYMAIDGDQDVFNVHKNTHPDCLVGSQIQRVLDSKFEIARIEMENSLKTMPLSDVIRDIESARK